MPELPALTHLRARGARIRAYAAQHKVISGIIILIFCYGAWYAYAAATAPSTATRYVTTAVASGTVVESLTETGQVSASQQITLSPKASGQVIGVYVKPGQYVYAGQVVAQLDATPALQSLKNAQLSFQNQQLSYAQSTATSTLSLNLTVAQNNVTTAEINLQKAHDTAYASLSSVYGDLSTVVTGLDSVLHNSNALGRTNQQNIDAYTDIVSAHDNSIMIYQNTAMTSYTTAYNAYTAQAARYKATSATISNDDLLALAKATYTTTQSVAEAVRNTHDFFDRVSSDYSLYNLGSSSALTTLLASTNTYTSTVAADLSNILGAQSSLVSAEQSLAQAQNALEIAQGGSNTLTVQQASLALQQAQDAVTNAQTTLAGYTVTAPFSGTIGSVGVQKYDQASSGTAVATLVTNDKTASISVNEVDASKLAVGQKAVLTFDALPDVSLAGTVASIDTVGSATQGVVSYNAVIAFDTQNPHVLPGMSVTANIIVGSQSGLVVSTTAIKSAGTQSYVEIFDPPLSGSESAAGAESSTTPERVIVTTGLSDDTNTIVTTGLTAGMQVVTKTIAGASATAKTTASAPSILNAAGAGARPAGARAGTATFRGGGG